jgi:hypothetical protein
MNWFAFSIVSPFLIAVTTVTGYVIAKYFESKRNK